MRCAASARPITAVNLPQGSRGMVTRSTQPEPSTCSVSPIHTSDSSSPQIVRFSPMKPAGSASSNRLAPPARRAACQYGRCSLG